MLAQQENQPPEAQKTPPPPHTNPSRPHPGNPLGEGNRLSPEDRAGRGHLSGGGTGAGGIYTEFSEDEGSGQVCFPVVEIGDMDEGGEMDGNDSSEMSEATTPCSVIF